MNSSVLVSAQSIDAFSAKEKIELLGVLSKQNPQVALSFWQHLGYPMLTPNGSSGSNGWYVQNPIEQCFEMGNEKAALEGLDALHDHLLQKLNAIEQKLVQEYHTLQRGDLGAKGYDGGYRRSALAPSGSLLELSIFNEDLKKNFPYSSGVKTLSEDTFFSMIIEKVLACGQREQEVLDAAAGKISDPMEHTSSKEALLGDTSQKEQSAPSPESARELRRSMEGMVMHFYLLESRLQHLKQLDKAIHDIGQAKYKAQVAGISEQAYWENVRASSQKDGDLPLFEKKEQRLKEARAYLEHKGEVSNGVPTRSAGVKANEEDARWHTLAAKCWGLSEVSPWVHYLLTAIKSDQLKGRRIPYVAYERTLLGSMPSALDTLIQLMPVEIVFNIPSGTLENVYLSEMRRNVLGTSFVGFPRKGKSVMDGFDMVLKNGNVHIHPFEAAHFGQKPQEAYQSIFKARFAQKSYYLEEPQDGKKVFSIWQMHEYGKWGREALWFAALSAPEGVRERALDLFCQRKFEYADLRIVAPYVGSSKYEKMSTVARRRYQAEDEQLKLLEESQVRKLYECLEMGQLGLLQKMLEKLANNGLVSGYPLHPFAAVSEKLDLSLADMCYVLNKPYVLEQLKEQYESMSGASVCEMPKDVSSGSVQVQFNLHKVEGGIAMRTRAAAQEVQPFVKDLLSFSQMGSSWSSSEALNALFLESAPIPGYQRAWEDAPNDSDSLCWHKCFVPAKIPLLVAARGSSKIENEQPLPRETLPSKVYGTIPFAPPIAYYGMDFGISSVSSQKALEFLKDHPYMSTQKGKLAQKKALASIESCAREIKNDQIKSQIEDYTLKAHLLLNEAVHIKGARGNSHSFERLLARSVQEQERLEVIPVKTRRL